MIKTLKNKLVLVFLVLSLVFTAIVGVGTSFANADELTMNSSDYFSIVKDGVSDKTASVITGGKLKTTIESDCSVKYFSDVVIDDFEIVFDYTADFKSIALNLTADSYYATGNKVDDELLEEVKNVLTLKLDGATLTANLNGGVNKTITTSFANSLSITVSITTENGYIIPVVNGETFANQNNDYRINAKETTVATLGFDFAVNKSASFDIDSITQFASDNTGDYDQGFELVAEDTLKDKTKAIVIVDQDFFSVDKDGNVKAVKYLNSRYEISWTTLNVVPGASITNSLRLSKADGISITNTSSAKASFILTKKVSELVLTTAESEVYKTINLTVVNKGDDADNKAPEYNFDAKAIESYKEALINATKKEYTIDGKTEEHYVQIGASQKIELPTMINLVSDDFTSYKELKATVYYLTPSTSGASEDFTVPIAEAGNYKFFVMFADVNGNTMKEEDFIETDEDKNFIGIADKYGAYVFTFTIEDDAPMTVSGAVQENGYKNVSYTADDFEIVAADYTTVYKLYYRANENAEWVEIPSYKDVDEDYDYTTLKTIGIKNYDDLEKVKYALGLTFTPTLFGEYKITCEVFATYSSRNAFGETFIKVNDELTVLNNGIIVWIENNVASFIFLTIGTLSLIGLIVVLCIKPKEKE